jgi:hypothetical protein
VCQAESGSPHEGCQADIATIDLHWIPLAQANRPFTSAPTGRGLRDHP